MPFLKLRDFTLFYTISGSGDPVLFLHGLGSSGRDWELQLPFFAQRYTAVTMDVRGHGQSDKPAGPYSVRQFAEDIAAGIRELGLAPMHVVGISMGGMIAFQLAVSHPALVRSLVIVNSGPELIVRSLRERLMVWQRFAIFRLIGMRGTGRFLSKRLFPKAEQADIRAEFVRRWAENDPRAYRQAMTALIGWSVTAELGKVTMPVLVVAADQDYTPVAAKEAYMARLPNAELVVVPDSHHALPVEQPQKFNELVAAFLERQSPATAPPMVLR